jgi:probable HAF family extracellular repeat protein
MKPRFLFWLAFFVAAVTGRAELYLFNDLGTVGSYNYFAPTGINNHGDVVGTAYESSGRPVAFRYAGGTFYTIPSPGPAHSTWGKGINADGGITGMCDRNGSTLHAFYAPAGGSATDFDSDMTRHTEAVAINNNNYVVGTANAEAFLGHASGWIYPLGSTLGTDFRAHGLNNSIVVVGSGTWGGMTYNAWTGTVTYLGWAVGSWSNEAWAINDSGEVAGKVSGHGYLYSGGVVTHFGANVSEVRGINSHGDIVGTTTAGHGFVYIRSTGHFVDLNAAITASTASTWTIVQATGINDGGVICAQARRLATPADGPGYGMYVYRAVKLSPFTIIIFPPITL